MQFSETLHWTNFTIITYMKEGQRRGAGEREWGLEGSWRRPGDRGVEGGEGRQAAAVARMRAACGAHAPCPSGARRGATGAGQSAGPACWPGQAAQCQAAGKLPFSYFFFFSNFLTFVWFNKNTKPFYLLMPIFIGASGIIPELLNKWHNFWTYIIYITNIYPKQIIIH